MSKTVIKIENLSKVYRLGEIGTGTISHDLNRWWTMNVRGKEDPFAKLGNENDRTAKAQKGELVAALSNINLEVKQGEIVGIIGKNGAGKSTLLKLLSRVTSPTTGSIKTLGRMASLLEVGTGFHPEMTGRENIYMNGTIMGMRKWEIDKQFDAIVDFSGVEKYIDTPVKRYSSGMNVRLGFAIAAHLEPEILVVDEVLAVGDADFQKKAIGKMQDVSKNDGRTVLFVSHNLTAIKKLCTRGILLSNGETSFAGNIEKTISHYILNDSQTSLEKKWAENISPGNEHVKLLSFSLIPVGEEIVMYEEFIIKLEFINYCNNINLDVGIYFYSEDDTLLFETICNISKNNDSKSGKVTATAKLQPQILNEGIYKINLIFARNRNVALFKFDGILTFEIIENDIDFIGKVHRYPGLIRPRLNWNVKEQ
jgi:lipopolysaccharide transport system ATP-binding protein